MPEDKVSEPLREVDIPAAYDDLCRLARARLARFATDQSVTPTDLVHEAYLRLAGKATHFEGHRHFFFAANRAMCDITVESHRRRASLKHGGDYLKIELQRAELTIKVPREDVLDLRRALDKFEHRRPDLAQVVQLRYFGGLTQEEIAQAMGASLTTIKRRWNNARA